MKLLVDMNLSPSWVERLVAHGFEAVHWSTVGAATAPDVEILAWANEHHFVVITNNLDCRPVEPRSVSAILECAGPVAGRARAVCVAHQHSCQVFAGIDVQIGERALAPNQRLRRSPVRHLLAVFQPARLVRLVVLALSEKIAAHRGHHEHGSSGGPRRRAVRQLRDGR